nr:DUF1206 domain-containing protein [Micrococcus endophyticus]
MERAARVGFVANGVLHLLIGLLALRVAAGDEQESTDTTGALQTLSGMPGGTALIWACLVGCAALALWNLGQAVWPADDGDRADRWKARGKAAGQAVVFAALAVVFGTYALGGTSDSAGSTSSLTARLMGHPADVVVLLLTGAGLVAMAGYYVVKGVTRRFRKDLRRASDPRVDRAVTALGTVGYPTKGLVLLTLGVLFLVSTATADPEDSTGLGGALQGLAAQPFGEAALGVLAVGLMLYGVYLMLRSRYEVM